jgi:hypothetical protein
MIRAFGTSLACLLSLFLLGLSGCGGSDPGTHLAFDLEGHHYEFKNAYSSVLGTTPATSYTLELTDLPCETTTRPDGSDLDLQLFPIGNESSYKVRVEFPDPTAAGKFVGGQGTVVVDQELPQLPFGDINATRKAIDALNVTLTGTVDIQAVAGTQTASASGTFRATHCRRTDSNF